MKFSVEALGGEIAVATEDNSFFAFDNIDLTDIKSVILGAFTQKENAVGGKIELRVGSPTGILVGEAEVRENNMVPVKIPLNKPPTGAPTKLYFVFKNANTGGKAICGVSTIEFSNK
jgi:cytochrome c